MINCGYLPVKTVWITTPEPNPNELSKAIGLTTNWLAGAITHDPLRLPNKFFRGGKRALLVLRFVEEEKNLEPAPERFHGVTACSRSHQWVLN